MGKIVIAIGGNAVIDRNKILDSRIQNKKVREALKKLIPVIKNNQVIITHGNGVQVGNLLLQNELTSKRTTTFSLDVLDAETEGQLGYLIQQNLDNLIKTKTVTTLLTQVLVSSKDKAFKNPTKFVGPFYNKQQADKLKKKFIIKKDSDRGFRRVVPSPKPIKIIESKAIQDLLKNNSVVIAAGGGGIPVIKKNNKLKGIEAVIDKDLASSCLANSIKADTLIMITDVDKVYLSYKQKNQKALTKVNLKQIREYYKQKQFPPGSMGPKIEAAINFLSSNGKKVIITNIKNIKSSLAGKAGTTITK